MFKPHIQQYFFIILTVFIIQGCVSLPSDVVMPQWDTNLNVPFATKSYILADIIKSQDYISIDAAHDSVYLINSDTYTQTVGISNFIKVSVGVPTSPLPVPTTNTEYSVLLPFPDGSELESATFISGKINITGTTPITNTAPATLSIRIPGVFNADGTAMSLSVTIQPNSTNSATYNFVSGSGYVKPANQSSTGFNLIAKATGPTNGLITFTANASDFVFSSVTGYLPTKSLGTQNNNFSLNLGDATKYRDKVTLKTGTLILQGKYNSPPPSAPFIVEVKNLKILGVRNNSGATKELSYNTPLNTFRFSSDGILSPDAYTETNSNITDFITFLPDEINISAEYIMNPDNSKDPRTATDADKVTFTTDFSSKSLLSINRTSFVDTLALDINQDSRDQIAKGQGVVATADIQNAIPLNSWIKVTLADEHYRPLFVVTKSTTGADSISFAGAVVDVNGNVTIPGDSLTTITLDSTQIRLLAQSAHYALVSVTVSTNGANNAPVLVRAKDWIKLNVYGSVNYRIKDDSK